MPQKWHDLNNLRRDLGNLIDYIKTQPEHHKKKTFEEEYRSLIMLSGIKIDEKYFP